MARLFSGHPARWRRGLHIKLPAALQPARAVAIAALALVLIASLFAGQAWVVALRTNQGSPQGTLSTSPLAQTGAPAPNATVSLDSDLVEQNASIIASGSGFWPLDTVTVRTADDSGNVRELARLDVDLRGAFSRREIKLPEWLTSGSHSIEAVGDRSGNRAVQTLYVHARERWVNLGSYGVKQADKLGFVVGGFAPLENVRIYLAEGENRQPDASASPLAVIQTDRSGNGAWTQIDVPLVKPGTYSLMFEGEQSNDAYLSRNIVVNALVPVLELSPWSGPPGSKVDLNGAGFVPDEQVGIYLGDDTEPAITPSADQYGNFWGAGPISVSYDARGPYRVTAIGQTSHNLVTRSFGITTPKPWVELSTYAGFAGTSVFFSGGGFAASERINVHLDNDSGPLISVGQASQQGYYRSIGPVNVPPAASGAVTFVLVGENSGASGSASFKVLTPWFLAPTTAR